MTTRTVVGLMVLFAGNLPPGSFAAARLPGQASPVGDVAQSRQMPLDAQVTLRPRGRASNRLSFRAEVVDYSGKGLLIKTPSGQQQHYAPEDVISVEPVLTSAHQEGDRLLARRQWREAVASYRAALEAEREPQRAWVRRQILAQMVKAFRGAGDLVMAGETFLLLYHSEPQTLYFSVIPLEWIGRVTGEPLRLRAQQWLGRKDPVAQLLGASHLLTTSERAQALAVLDEELSRALDARIRGLARAQVWRTRVATVDLQQLEGWRRQMEEIPPGLRGGPYYVLGKAYAQLSDPQSAALAYLWVPLVYDDDRELAGQALLGAARALEKLGQRTEAVALVGEVRERFGETDAAREAAGVLSTGSGVMQ